MQDSLDPFELSPDPAIVFGADGARIHANAAFTRAFPHAASSQRPPWGRTLPPDFVDGERRFEAAAPDGRRYEWRERRLPDGSRIAVARDVTARVEAAEQAARAKTVLFATLTHELRTPLNGVMGMADILAQTVRGPAEQEYLQAIRKSGDHLLTLITDILDYARLETETFQTEEKIFDPEDMAQSIAELLSPRAFEKGVDICVRVAAETPRLIAADERRLRQILFNLVGNAVKFTPTGGVMIDVSAIEGGKLRFTVRDTGPGVPAEMQRRIFEEFVQVDSSHARLFGGAGLGLAIVRKLAVWLGGEVGIESAPGKGAAFWVDLPATLVERDRLPAHPLAGLRVLIAAPEKFLAAGLAETIAQAGGVPTTVPTGRIDAVLLDHTQAHARADELSALGAPIVVLVPQEDRAALDSYRGLNLQHYLVKPLRRASLTARILAATGRVTGAGAGDLVRRSSPALAARVLLAEDNPVNALIARTLLERVGCAVTLAENGAAALEAVRAQAFDIVFLDLRMPVLDGIGAARRIRALGGVYARLPLVALTADAGDEERAQALAAGMDDFITKPIEPKRLADILARFTQEPNEAKLALP